MIPHKESSRCRVRIGLNVLLNIQDHLVCEVPFLVCLLKAEAGGIGLKLSRFKTANLLA